MNLSRRHKDQVETLVFDFDGVFTDNKVILEEDGTEHVVCDRRDGKGIELLQKAGFHTFILSGEENRVVKERANKLGMKCWHGVDNKLELLNKECSDRDIPLEKVCYVGNDVNDVACLEEVYLGIGVKDSHQTVLEVCDLVTERVGGNAAVREICDAFLT